MTKTTPVEIIDACAAALGEKHNFNAQQVKRSMQLFRMDAFANAPRLTGIGWHYLRDSSTHSALVFNSNSREIRFIDEKHYWDESTLNYYRASEHEVAKSGEDELSRLKGILRSDLYLEMADVLSWVFSCPKHLPGNDGAARVFSPEAFVLDALQGFPYTFNKEKAEKECRNLLDGYHYTEELKKEKTLSVPKKSTEE
jgi:hypothetical protein